MNCDNAPSPKGAFDIYGGDHLPSEIAFVLLNIILPAAAVLAVAGAILFFKYRKTHKGLKRTGQAMMLIAAFLVCFTLGMFMPQRTRMR